MALASGRHWDAAAVLAASNEWSWVPPGAYRAVLAERLRIGFTRYGEQRQLVLDL